MTLLKICGVMNERDAALCAELGADMIGFVVEYPRPVPWNLSREAARAPMEAARGASTCVVTGGPAGRVIDLARYLAPDFVQLHAGEDLAAVRETASTLAPLGTSVIKTLPASVAERTAQFGTADVSRCAELARDAGAAMLLVDSRGPSNAAVGGGAFDEGLYLEARRGSALPVILAGGIGAENAAAVAARLRPYMIDVMTGSETEPGTKDRARIAALAAAVRAYGTAPLSG